MKSKLWILLLIFLSWMLTACGQNGRYQVTLITEGAHVLLGTTFGDLIILGGNVVLERGAALDGNTHLLAGKLSLDGEIHGDVSMMAGELAFGPEARVSGDLNIGGGQLSGLDQAIVTGKVNTGSGMQIPSQPARQPQDSGGTQLRWLVSAVVFGLVASVLERYLPRQISYVSEAAFQHLPVSLALGMLAGIVGLSLLVLLAYTIILIPVALLGLFSLGLAVTYSWVACGISLGNWAASRLKVEYGKHWAVFSGTMFFILLLNALTAVPRAGGIFGIFVAATGLGAVFLTRFGIHRFIPESANDLST
jgi:hypothetical protein